MIFIRIIVKDYNSIQPSAKDIFIMFKSDYIFNLSTNK
jgi:hypothetical protein